MTEVMERECVDIQTTGSRRSSSKIRHKQSCVLITVLEGTPNDSTELKDSEDNSVGSMNKNPLTADVEKNIESGSGYNVRITLNGETASETLPEIQTVTRRRRRHPLDIEEIDNRNRRNDRDNRLSQSEGKLVPIEGFKDGEGEDTLIYRPKCYSMLDLTSISIDDER